MPECVKSMACDRYMKGECTLGDQCKWSHDADIVDAQEKKVTAEGIARRHREAAAKTQSRARAVVAAIGTDNRQQMEHQANGPPRPPRSFADNNSEEV